jgi:hypothetical protein
MELYECSRCLEQKAIKDFPLKKGKREMWWCRECRNAHYRHLYATNPARRERAKALSAANRPNYRGKRYGLTPDEYDTLVASNDGMCHLNCGRLAEVIDHDHETGKVRGRLCYRCNTALGKLGDTEDSIRKVFEYVSRA